MKRKRLPEGNIPLGGLFVGRSFSTIEAMSEKVIQKTRRTAERDLTRGPILSELLLFALPLFLVQLVQLLYNTVDVYIAGRFLQGPQPMAAVGASGMLVTLFLKFFFGMSVGAGVAVSHAYGAKDETRLSNAVHTAVAIAFFGGLFVMASGYVLSPTILRWMNTPEDIFDLASSYIQIYFLGALPIVFYDLGVGILRAMGDSRTPLYYQIVGGVLNVLLDVLFVVLLDLGVKGIAYATILSQTVPACLVLVHLLRSKGPHRLYLQKVRFHKEALLDILRVGVPAAVQAIVLTLSNVVVQSQINTFGSNTIAAFTIYYKLEDIMYLPILAYGQTATTFVGQNVGAGKPNRVYRGVHLCLLIGLATSVVTSGLCLLFARQLFGIFTPEQTVIDIGMQFFYVNGAMYFLYNFIEVYSGAIRGSGNALVPMTVALFNLCVVRLGVLFFVVSHFRTVLTVGLCYPITWFTTGLCLVAYYYAKIASEKTHRKNEKKRENER